MVEGVNSRRFALLRLLLPFELAGLYKTILRDDRDFRFRCSGFHYQRRPVRVKHDEAK